MDDLKDFLRRMAGEPFRYGYTDCGMTVASWVQLRTGVDPAARLRGSYETMMGWRRLADKAGGLDRLVGSLVEPVGLVATTSPSEGDVGVVELKDIGEAAVGIRTRRGWALKLYDGIVVGDFPLIAAWRF